MENLITLAWYKKDQEGTPEGSEVLRSKVSGVGGGGGCTWMDLN